MISAMPGCQIRRPGLVSMAWQFFISPNCLMCQTYTNAPVCRVFFDVTIDSQPAGRIVMELFDEVVPRTARNFYSIASGQNQQGFTYRGTIFHRIIPQFMLQVREYSLLYMVSQ